MTVTGWPSALPSGRGDKAAEIIVVGPAGGLGLISVIGCEGYGLIPPALWCSENGSAKVVAPASPQHLAPVVFLASCSCSFLCDLLVLIIFLDT